ncbi:MAG: NUDIX domain-containing protein [Maledivibacter sp.]|jgi:predicted NUDIX family phosphoesterase|nr:NUDIX domain-containing protein [Maledivibacter sp.]
MAEKVLVVHKDLLKEYFKDISYGLIVDNTDLIFDKALKNHSFLDRDIAEYDYDYRQIIPYIIVKNEDSYLLLKRLNKQTEKRLHGKYSLGVGGHINPDPSNKYENVIMSGLYRELNEEISIKEPFELTFAGVINNQTSDVGKVHVGFLYILEASSLDFEVLEKEKMTGEWVTQEELTAYYEYLEGWSQIVFDNYIK